MTAATSAPVEPPDATGATMALLRELRSGRARQQASNVMFWLYVAGLFILVYGGWAVAAAAHALQHPPPPLPVTPQLERAAPAALCALALLLLAAQLWDARWRGPVTLTLPAADWLLGTLVRRDTLLRPRYRASALAALGAGAVAGLVPVAAMLAAGLGGSSAGHALRLALASMLSTALLAGCGTGLAGLAEAGDGPGAAGARRLAWARRLELRGAAIRLMMLAALALVGLAAAAAAVRLPAVIGTVLLWSGPWGWAAQAPVALAAGTAPLWPVAIGLLAVAAAALLVAGDRVAPLVPAAVLRARARTMGNMSAAVLNLDGRRVTIAYRDAGAAAGRARITFPAPRRRELVLVWRDLLALLRAPSRLAWSLLLALTATGLAALAVRVPRDSVLPLALALIAGYLAAAGVCEAARLDADDPRRSGGLPFRFQSLPWRHAVVPWLALTLFAGLPAAALALLTGHSLLLVLVPAATAALIGGALVNSFRGQLEGEMYGGFDTPMGHSSGVTITLWYVTGPLLAVAPMIVICRAALLSRTAGGVATAAVVGVALAGWLGYVASNRAARLRG